jgi:uncharacterized protein YkwD
MNRLLVACSIALCLLPLHAQKVTSTTEMERQIFDWTNQEREKAHVPPLEWNGRLAVAARLHSDEMAKQGQLSHQLPNEPAFSQRISDRGARFSAAAENVGFADDAETLQSGWMHSPGHRANILNPTYDEIGIGIVRKGDRFYATEDFDKGVQNLSAQEFEDGVTNEIARIRRQRGLAQFRVTHSLSLERTACSGETSARAAFADVNHPGAAEMRAFNFTAQSPDQLSNNLKQRVLDLPTGAVSIGACSTSDPAKGFSGYRVLIVLYR